MRFAALRSKIAALFSAVLPGRQWSSLEKAATREIILRDWYFTSPTCTNEELTFIVFSKDRPLQLSAALESLDRADASLSPVTVLYCASTPEYRIGYDRLISVFSSQRNVVWVRQKSAHTFRDDLRRVVGALRPGRLAFLVDDIIFVNSFNIHDFDRFDLRTTVPSLRLGKNVTYCYTTERAQVPPPLLLDDSGLMRWRWSNGELDWGYPMSLDGNMFLTTEMNTLTKLLQYWSPNTLEIALSEYSDLYGGRDGVCYETSRLVNFPINLVQSDFDNRHGETTAYRLLEKWQEGFRVDTDSLWGRTFDAVHVDTELPLVKRH